MPFDVAALSLSSSEEYWKRFISVGPKASSNSTPHSVASSISVCDKDSNFTAPATSPPPARPFTLESSKSPTKRITNNRRLTNNDLEEDSDFRGDYDDKVGRKAPHSSPNRRLFIQADTSPASFESPSSAIYPLVIKSPTPFSIAPPRSTTSERIFRPYMTKPFEPCELHDKLLQEIFQDVSKSDKAGCIYSLTDRQSPGYVKVGRTATTVRKRVADQGYKCGFDPDIEDDPYQRETAFQLKLEKFVHTELAAYRRKEILCRRGKGCDVKTHVEWFQIDSLAVSKAVERWRKWLEMGVYVAGKLDQKWVDKVELLVYVEGQSWGDTWNEWMSLVAKY